MNKNEIQNSRRNFIKKMAIGAFVPTLVGQACSNLSTTERLTILHTNDVHSHIDPFPENHTKYPGMGGYARRATLIKQIRKEEKNVVLLDSGDIFQGTPYFNFYKGELDISLMGKLGYDAATIGNHEFDNGIEELAKQISKAKFPFISSNYDFNHTPLNNGTLPYKVIQKGELKIGIIGLGIELKGLVDSKMYGSTVYQDPISIGDKTAKTLKEKEKCNIVICLSHLGYKYDNDQISDIKLASNTRYIDVILGGHTHTFLDKPTLIKNLNQNNVVINQTGWAGINLGRLDFTFGTNNKSNYLSFAQLI